MFKSSISRARTWRRARVLSLSIVAAVAAPQCAPRCAPTAAPSCPTISWPGRAPVCVVSAPADGTNGRAQRLLDQGRAVDITGNTDPGDGYAHVAGHRSGVFGAGPNLRVGTTIAYAGRTYRVVGDAVARAGEYFQFRPGLTVQYSLGGGSVRLVFADPV